MGNHAKTDFGAESLAEFYDLPRIGGATTSPNCQWEGKLRSMQQDWKSGILGLPSVGAASVTPLYENYVDVLC